MPDDAVDMAAADTERRLRLLLETTADCVFRVRVWPELAPEYISPSVRELIGCSAEELHARPERLREIVHPDDRAAAHALGRIDGAARTVLRCLRTDGTVVWVEISCRFVSDGGGARHVEGIARDVSEREIAREQLERTQALFRAAFDQAPIGMGLTATDPEKVDKPLHVNPALCRFLGRTEGEIKAIGLEALTHPDDRGRGLDLKHRLLAGEIPDFRIEKRYLHADGTVRWGAFHGSLVRDADGRPLFGLGQVEDITDRRAHEAELARRALHDGLTGLPNRAILLDRLTHALERRPGGPDERIGVLFVDVDDLKGVNDTLGHAAGDVLVRHVARLLLECVRPADTVARISGDEFVVVCEALPTADAAVELAERVVSAFGDASAEHDGRAIGCTVSVGVATGAPGAGVGPQRLLADADAALLRAKELGKARAQSFDDELRARVRIRRHTETDLRLAIERDELRLVYQPMISLADGRITALEALLRWEHPTRGMLSPGEFIPVAERLDLIGALGSWVLGRACDELSSVVGGTDMRVSINLSSRQLADTGLVAEVRDMLVQTDFSGRQLCFEVTETGIVDEPIRGLEILEGLRALDASVAIDDFGTGYSSLAQLRHLPVDVLKLDRAFVAAVEEDPRDAAVISAVVSMASALGLEVVAEGIETEGQLCRVRELGCDVGQGWHFAKAMPVQELVSRGLIG